MKSIAATLVRTLVALAWLVGAAPAVEAATASWNPNPEPDIAGYVLSYGMVSGTHTTAIDVGNITTVLVALTPGVQYFFVLQAYNTSGLFSPFSSEVAFTVDPGAPVFTAQPVGQTVTAGQGASFSVATNGTPVPTYQWQISTNGGVSWTNLANTAQYGGVTTGTLTLTAVSSGLTGTAYRAVATSSAGTTPSNVARLTVDTSAPPAPPVPPASPLPAAPNSPNVDGQAGVTPTPNLSWQAAGATSYELRLGTANPPPTYVSNLPTYWYAPQPLAGGTKYFWQVVASNSSGSTTGPVWSFTTAVGGGPSSVGPAAPNSPNVADGTAGVTPTPNLSWQAAGATSYELRLGTANPPPSYVSNLPTYWYGPQPLAGGTKYFWQVVASNSSGSTPGPVWSFTTAVSGPSSSGPAAPNSPNVTDGTAGVTPTPNLSWQAAGATSYELRISTANPPSTYVSNLSSYWYGLQLAGGTKYFWQVVASNSGGSTTGPVWSFTTAGASSTPPPPSGGGAQISVLDWNIHVADSSEAHARLSIDLALAASPRLQVITFQEAWSQHMPAYIDELQRQTGQTWYGVSQPQCPSGAWNGSSCTEVGNEVVAIFSTFPIGSTDAIYLPWADCWTSARPGLRAALNVNGTTLQVFTTHLQTGGCTNDVQSRSNSMSLLKSWASNYSGAKLFSGDFNADSDQIDTAQGMAGPFLNPAVTLGLSKPLTAFAPSPNMQLDYWFYDTSGRLQPVSIDVPNTGTAVSDHYPVRATFILQ